MLPLHSLTSCGLPPASSDAVWAAVVDDGVLACQAGRATYLADVSIQTFHLEMCRCWCSHYGLGMIRIMLLQQRVFWLCYKSLLPITSLRGMERGLKICDFHRFRRHNCAGSAKSWHHRAVQLLRLGPGTHRSQVELS
jgi:hypothetical protein